MPATFDLDNIGVRKPTPDGYSRWILDDFSIHFHSNERIGLLGRNGSGKTTLLRVIGRLDKVARGALTLYPRKVQVAMMLQRPEEHFVRSTVGEQIHSYAPRSLSADSVYKIMNQVGLTSDLAKQPPLRLSTGQQRLVAIACALAFEPAFMILDEPMAGLDATGRRALRDALINIHKTQEVGWIIVSHHADDLFSIVDRIWILEEGKLLHDGPFSMPSLDSLSKCIATHDSSLYYRLAHAASQGTILPKELFSNSMDEIAQFLRGLKLK